MIPIMEKDRLGRDSKFHAGQLNPLEAIGLLYYIVSAQFPSLDHRINFSANIHLLRLALDILQGKTASQSPAELRPKLFPNYETETWGSENIPQNGSFIAASNHYDLGPLKGSWQTAVIADIVLNKIPDSKRSFHFIIDSEKESTGILGETIRDEFRKQQRHTLRNIAAALDYIPLNQMRKALELLHQGQEGNNIIGTFPTGKAELAFKTPVPKEAGTLFEIAGKNNIPVLPIGAWHDGRKKIFTINIGKAAIYKNNPKDPNSKQLTAKIVMRGIASLLPPQMRGIYAS